MKVTIEFNIDKKLDLEFGKIIQSFSRILKKLKIDWKYKVETSINEYIKE